MQKRGVAVEIHPRGAVPAATDTLASLCARVASEEGKRKLQKDITFEEKKGDCEEGGEEGVKNILFFSTLPPACFARA